MSEFSAGLENKFRPDLNNKHQTQLLSMAKNIHQKKVKSAQKRENEILQHFDIKSRF